MKVIPFIADSAAEAATQIRTQLGPEAVVLNVRQIRPDGLARLWAKPRLEVLAYVPETVPRSAPATPAANSPPNAPALQPGPLSLPLDSGSMQPAPLDQLETTEPLHATNGFRDYGGWRIGPVLEGMGLLPFHARKIVNRLQLAHGESPPNALGEEIQLARAHLRGAWPKTPPDESTPGTRHVLVGPPGTGKTTCICKWLAQSVLAESRTARVWRLDGRTANTSELLTVYGDILGVPVERAQGGDSVIESLLFVDLPGVNWRDSSAIQDLSKVVATVPRPKLHLVLNAAYELNILLAQVRAFSALPIQDLIVTHLDEENNWGKLWNLVLGTNYTLRFLGTGQNIPGDFCEASADRLLSQQFRCG